METTMAEYKSSAREKANNRGEARGVSISRAENDGFIAKTDFSPKNPKGPWPNTEETVHATMDDLMTHIKGRLGNPGAETAAAEKAEGKHSEKAEKKAGKE